jgi:hypothetical protein
MFQTRYKEHIREIKTNGQKSKYAQHILYTTHNYDKAEKTMKILHIEKKGRMLNILESYHIYELTKQKLQMNEALTDNYNPIKRKTITYGTLPPSRINYPPIYEATKHSILSLPPATALYIVTRQRDISTTPQPRQTIALKRK